MVGRSEAGPAEHAVVGAEPRGELGGVLSRGHADVLVAAAAFGPWAPRPMWNAIQRVHWGHSTSQGGAGLLSSRATASLPDNFAASSRSSRPSADQRAERAALLQGADPGLFRKGTLAVWGIDERDPTTDRDLVDFCLALPAEQLLRGGETRSLARRALSDRLPEEVLHGPRGYQGADWFERIDKKAILQALTLLAVSIRSTGVLNYAALESLARQWPTDNWHSGSTISTFRYALPRAIAAAAFMAAFDLGTESALRAATGTEAR